MMLAHRPLPSTPGARALAALLTLALATTTTPAVASQPSQDVQQLYVQGQEKFDQGDFVGASASWNQALDRVPEGQSTKSTRELLVIQVMNASRDAYRQTQDAQHLRNGRDSVDRYIAAFKMAYGQDAVVSDAVQQARVNLLQELQQAEAQSPTPAPTPTPAPAADSPSTWEEVEQPQPAPEPTPAPEEAQPAAPTPSTPPPPAPADAAGPKGSGTGLIATGAVFTVLAAGGAGLLVAGLVVGGRQNQEFEDATTGSARDDANSKGELMNKLAIVGGVVTPVMLGLGIGLLSAGVKRRKQSRMAWTPAIAPGFAGVTVGGEF